MEHDRIYHRDLGALGYQKGPQSIHRWHGDMEGCEQGFDIILNAPDLDLADAGLIAGVVRHGDRYRKAALEYLRMKLAEEPELCQLSKADGAEASRREEIPFDRPLFIFYEGREWMILFLENGLDFGGQFGVSVEFSGETPVSVCDLSDAEEIEDD